MHKLVFAVPWVWVLCAATLGAADIIVLKNGNTLEGEAIAETSRQVVVRLPTGVMNFSRRQVKEIRRDSAAAREQQSTQSFIYLRDGRRVTGSITRGNGRFVTLITPLGDLVYPAWMVAPSQRYADLWQSLRRLENPRSRRLLGELSDRYKELPRLPIEERDRGFPDRQRNEELYPNLVA